MKTLRLLPAALGLALAAQSALADDDLAFTDRSLKGVWGFSGLGTIVPPATPAPIPAAAVGIMRFDGDGFCAISDTVNIGGGSASRETFSCEYAVNPDGSGTITAEFPGDPGPVPLSFVLVRGAKAFHWIRTDLGVARGTAERQGRPRHHDD